MLNRATQTAKNQHQRIGLSNRTRETIKDKAVTAIILSKAFFHNTEHYLIRNQTTLLHNRLGLQTERGLFFYRSTQHVPGGYLWHSVRVYEELCLGTLTSARRSEQDKIHGST